MKNSRTGAVLDVPPPNELGESVVRLNGRIIEQVFYGDLDGGSVRLGDGRSFRVGKEFADYLIALLAAAPPPTDSVGGSKP